MSGVTAPVAKMPVRNPSFRLSSTVNEATHGNAICGFHRGCGLTIRSLKKKGPKKGPTRRIDDARCRFPARNLLQRNDFRVGRRGLEPRTYGLKVSPCMTLGFKMSFSTNDSGSARTTQTHRDQPRKGQRKGQASTSLRDRGTVSTTVVQHDGPTPRMPDVGPRLRWWWCWPP